MVWPPPKAVSRLKVTGTTSCCCVLAGNAQLRPQFSLKYPRHSGIHHDRVPFLSQNLAPLPQQLEWLLHATWTQEAPNLRQTREASSVAPLLLDVPQARFRLLSASRGIESMEERQAILDSASRL